ncbi:MAG: hypothetical protein O6766_13705 [Gammaproteobacteria bacterium]|nr:hypothetical protein [Gammaproteobacteria bacterium]
MKSSSHCPSSHYPSSNYAADHFIAKLAIYLTYVLVGAISIESGNSYVALFLGTGVWLFGINGAAYLVEVLRGHHHCHNLW